MYTAHCKLPKKCQFRLHETFVINVPAISATIILEIQPNSAIFFYRNVRQIMTFNLEIQSCEMFGEEIELAESYFGGCVAIKNYLVNDFRLSSGNAQERK